MTWKRRIVISLLIGFGISGAGVLMVHFGGYGPCGPASRTAEIGECLGLRQTIALFEAFPSLEGRLMASGPPWLFLVIVVVVPGLSWALVLLVLLSVVSWLRRRMRVGG